MTDAETLAFVRRVLAVYDGFDGPEAGGDLWWRVDGEYAPVTFFAICNDLFWWGTADLEAITPDNVGALERAMADCRSIDPVVGVCEGTGLFCCRVRGLRPQGVAYPKDERFWPLFDACGPERVVDFGNPKPHPSQRRAAETNTESEMTLKDLAMQFVEQVKAGKVGDALDTGAEFLKQFASFYKMVFGAASEELLHDMADAEAELEKLKADLLAGCSCEGKDGSCQTIVAAVDAAPKVDPVLIIGIVELILKLIAERRKNK